MVKQCPVCQRQNRCKFCLVSKQARDPKRCPPSKGRPLASSSLVLTRCLVARPWPGWGSLLPLAPQRAPCPVACPVPGQAACLGATQAEQLYRQCQELGASPRGSSTLPVLLGPQGWRGRASAFSFIPPERSRQGAQALLLGEWQLLRPVLHLCSPCPGAGGSASACSRLTCANITLAKWPFQREEVPGCLKRDLALLSPGQLVFCTQAG